MEKIERKNVELYQRAKECWDELGSYRRERHRAKNFSFGDQIEKDETQALSEAVSQGESTVVLLKNNIIRRLLRNVLGVFRNQWNFPQYEGEGKDAEYDRRMAAEFRKHLLLNQSEELYARSMEEFLIGGLVVHRKWYGRRGVKTGCWTEFVSPDQFFCDIRARDCRGWDAMIVGQIHIVPFDKLLSEIGKSAKDRDRLESLYPGSEPHRECMVWEIWYRRQVPHYYVFDSQTGKIEVRDSPLHSDDPMVCEDRWSYSFLTPDATVLEEGDSPYSHGGHPFVIKGYPFIDGEIHSFVTDIIDQQKYTNRLISMFDWILRISAKGLLLIPEGSLPTGTDVFNIKREWSRSNGVLVYRHNPGMPLPQQVSANCSNIGISELLNIQLRMMEDISGVNGAIQGKLDNTSMSGKLYDQQTRNSLASLVDMLKTFDSFIEEGCLMDISNLRQYCMKG